ncbi:MAG: DUF2723 domain-containing protein [Muribaculaceae bacterium]|nr:DUF2723 domain-containing protein [Muribaculaceae bacterium]
MWIRRTTVFFGALILYLICLDRGASFWDCPEYILIAWRLEVGHPPGNPTWQLLANVTSHLGGSAEHAAVMINGLSALCMALASLCLSEIIYIFLRMSLLRRGAVARSSLWASLCAACGALCYAWCDSAIFSAVEAEVYALSALLTALMLLLSLRWAILRRRGRIAAARRVLILTAYLAGLGVGVHELNFLVLPAMALIYFFWGSRRWRRSSYPTAGWSLLLFCIGLTTYLLIPIRAAANPPVNEGDPSTWSAFKNYYGRTQYGSKPLLYGRTPYSKPLLQERLDSATGELLYDRYAIRQYGDGKKEYIYPRELDMWLPRMTSSDPADIEFYEAWAGMTPDEMTPVEASAVVDTAGQQNGRLNPETGGREMRSTFRPTYLQQLRYLAAYQVGYMYMRYLLWNFAGRQNNIHSTGGTETGNFITGIAPLDDAMLGDQSRLSPSMREDNPGYNRYFLIPLAMGVIGIVALCRRRNGRRVCAVVATLFLFTGLLIVVYLNQDPGEPRERDYSFLGSYMAYAIWIGCGLAAIVRSLLAIKTKRPSIGRMLRIVAVTICVGVPLQMLTQTYDDHNRSRMPGADALARTLLEAAPRDAVLLASGDNTIFPLWYGQEVLGLRRDVTVVATPYLSADWYRIQLRRPGEESLPLATPDSVPPGRGAMADRVVEFIRLNNPGRPLLKAGRDGTLTPLDTAK